MLMELLNNDGTTKIKLIQFQISYYQYNNQDLALVIFTDLSSLGKNALEYINQLNEFQDGI